jgi:shikimate kinase
MNEHRRATIALSGFMGVGKTIVSRHLGELTGAALVDLDERIEAHSGRPIAQLFAEHGEAAFRELEADLLRQCLADNGPTILALGGGTLVNDASRAHALAHAFVVTLTASPDIIAARCASSDRPLLAVDDPLAVIADLLAARDAAYREAHLIVPTDAVPPASVATTLADRWIGWRGD